MFKILVIAAILFFPLNKVEKPILILNATTILGNGTKIDNSAIIFENGKFLLVGDATSIKLDLSRYQVIHAEGKYIYPIDMVKDKFCPYKKITGVLAHTSSVLMEGKEATFAILSAPRDQCGAVESVYVKGNKINLEFLRSVCN
jgi:hypothetical protein